MMRWTVAWCLLAVCAAAKADGIGTTVNGMLTFPATAGQKNFFAPTSLTIGGGQSFGFNDGAVQLSASFTGSTLTITNDYNGYGIAPITEIFTDPAFAGFTPVATLPSGFSYSFSGDTLTVNEPSNGPNEVVTFNYTTASATPEPSSLILLGTGVLGLAGVARRRFAKRRSHSRQPAFRLS